MCVCICIYIYIYREIEREKEREREREKERERESAFLVATRRRRLVPGQEVPAPSLPPSLPPAKSTYRERVVYCQTSGPNPLHHQDNLVDWPRDLRDAEGFMVHGKRLGWGSGVWECGVLFEVES